MEAPPAATTFGTLGLVYIFAYSQVAFTMLTYLFTVYFSTDMGCWLPGFRS